jgi:glucokinase
MRVLTGDIGGTNSRLAIVDVTAGNAEILHQARFRSRDYPGLGPIVRRFLSDARIEVERAAFGIACPVIDGDCTMANLPWKLSATALAREIGIPRTVLINDLQATGHGLALLHGGDLVTLQAGEPEPHGAIAVIAAGTGLGEAFLTREGDHHAVHVSEGGHASYAPNGSLECGLLEFLRDRFGHVSRERVMSGPGLVSIYEYLAECGLAGEVTSVRREMEREEPAAVISRHALAGTDPLCVRALDVFASAYGAQAGNLALTVMATGGVYLGGGIAHRIVDKLKDGGFVTAFREKGRLAGLLAKIPVHVIVNPSVGLLGAAAVAASPG